MVVKDIFKTNSPARLADLIREVPFIDVKEEKKQWDSEKHKVITNEDDILPNKLIKDKNGNIVRERKVNRISTAYQKLIVNRLVAFGFANPIILESEPENELQEQVLNSIKSIQHKVKERSFNKKVARDLYRSKQVAELWYFTRNKNNYYGFESDFKFNVLKLSPWNGDKLRPIFDNYGDLIAFSREYTVKEASYIDIWTDEQKVRLTSNDGTVWKEESTPHNFGKIPIVFGSQEHAEWRDIQRNIERLEMLLSKHAEINDYNAAPKTFVKGIVSSLPQAGEANPTLQGGENTDVKVLSWEAAPESIRLEIENLIENIHKFSQVPNISFESIRGMGQISGVMLKMLFTDTYLKIMEKNEIWDEYFSRRYSLLNSMLQSIHPPYQDNGLEITPVVQPYKIEDEEAYLNLLMSASGSRSIISRRTAIEKSGLVDDVGAEMERIRDDEEQDRTFDIFQPTNF